MSQAGQVVSRLMLDYSQFSPANAEAMAQIEALTQKVRQLEEQLAKINKGGGGGRKKGGWLQELGESWGRSSGLAQFQRLLMGGGAIAAASMLAREFGQVGQKVGELADKMRAGAMGAQDFYMELTGSLPIIGEIQKGLIGIAQAIAPVGQDVTKQIATLADEAAKLHTKAKAETAGDPVMKARIEAMAAYEEEVKKIRALEKEAAGDQNQYAGMAHKTAEQMIRDAAAIRDAAIAEAASNVKKEKEQKNAADEMIETLRRKNFELAKGAEGLLKYEMIAKGATLEQIALAESFRVANEQLESAAEDEKKWQEALHQHEEEIRSVTEALQEQLNTYGMSEAQIRAYKLAQLGADEATIKWSNDAANWLDAQKAWDDEVKRGEELWKQFQTPLQKYGEEVEEFEKLLDDGVWTWEQYATAVEAANKKLDDAEKKTAESKIGQRETSDAMLARIQGALMENAFGEKQKENKNSQYSADSRALEKTASHSEQTVKALDKVNGTLERIERKKDVATFQ